ncbi:hypothetical protein CLV24_13217 [Pontibacter ummariensis]|uniref:Outer membrane protein beta-barrel family protein n=1 Tax=Pontibacter ummariensis TaxID=1610492 RepID=A0A239KYL7_9BACT|nr:hypothetical protein [Pontibacter ummariensis]PRY04939.1 hypothetical protein CLV24_13217 [Pontibacter ummariensis]SNT22354.1 hypothetical protein SAMN06296052_13229 [Pontibacter ummariensis]
MRKKRFYLVLLLCWLSLPLLAQPPANNQRCKWVPVISYPQRLDTLTLLPSSVTLHHPKKEQFAFDYNYTLNEFTLTKFPTPDSIAIDSLGTMAPLRDSVLVCFRVLPLNLTKPAFRRDIAKLEMNSFRDGFYQEDIATREEIFRTPGLNKTGSISRGISFGNTQNVFVNSALNLQLDGKLTDDISITAAITDQNIPFQPEGNTQQLQEFDKVYITLRHRLWQLTAGDVVLQNKPSYFLKYYKNVQGAAFETNLGKTPDRQGVTTVAASVSKGKFASQAIQPAEGVLGPYRLRGPNNERFIIVLANSERVFLDGKLLVRGYDYDYVIDYNQAEITFTTRHVITKNSRIKVDFEYSDQNYSRGIYNLSHYQTLGKVKVFANYYNESDNRNNLLNLNLQTEEKRLLSQIGDDLERAVSAGADSVAFDPAQVLYARRDTMYNAGQSYASIYVHSTSPDSAFYNVSFTEVGAKRGDYVAVNNATNGRVYKWVAPVNGVPQGNYTPMRVLPTPKKKQLITLGTSYELQQGMSFFIEGAASENDINRFSSLDADDDKGKALRVGYLVQDRELAFMGKYRLNSALNYEYTDEYFSPIDRYRPIEFDRDWSLATTEAAEDHILNFSVGAVQDAANALNYRISSRRREGQLNGVQHYFDLVKTVGKAAFSNHLFVLSSQQGERESEWYRGDFGLAYKLGKLAPGYTYRFDKNRITALGSDSVVASAMYFEEHLVYLQSGDSTRTRFRLDYSHRTDKRPTGRGDLDQPEVGQTYNAILQTPLGANSDLALQATYRKLEVATGDEEETIQSRVDWNAGFLDGSFQSELSYATGTGRELKRIYIFQETLPGQGTHYLRDEGNPANLNDYLEAQTVDQRRYIKIFLPTDEYINAYTNRFTYRLTSNTPVSWRAEKGLKEKLSHFSMLTFLSIDKKTTDDNLQQRFNPFSQEIEDQFLISFVKSLRHTMYYNRSNPKYGLEYTLQQNQQKSLLANGSETRLVGSHVFVGRLNLNEVLSSQMNLALNVRENKSNFLSSKNFRIESRELSPELAYQPNMKLRFTGKYQYSLRQDMLAPSDAEQQGAFHELGLEAKLSQVSKRTFTGNIKYVNIDFTGDMNSYVGYEILNALRPGNNMTWSLNLQQRLSNGLNISLNYDGRKANGVGAVHTGRTQVSVLF